MDAAPPATDKQIAFLEEHTTDHHGANYVMLCLCARIREEQARSKEWEQLANRLQDVLEENGL